MTFIPDPNVLKRDDIVYLTKDVFVANYGQFTKGHQFKVTGLPFRDSDRRVELCDDECRVLNLLPNAVTKVRP